MERLETMVLDFEECPFFIPDVNQVSVPVFMGGAGVLYNGIHFDIFDKVDNFIVYSMGIILPEYFVFAQGGSNLNHYAKLRLQAWTDPGNVKVRLPQFGGDDLFTNGDLVIPMENYEYALNVFIDMYNSMTDQGIAIERFRLKLELVGDPLVSMIGCPAVLNGVEQKIRCFVKVLHTLPLIGGV